jgi:hypothetical protein
VILCMAQAVTAGWVSSTSFAGGELENPRKVGRGTSSCSGSSLASQASQARHTEARLK